MKSVIAGGILLASVVSLPAFADEFTPNRSEVSFSGNITSSSYSGGSASSTSSFLYGSYGYYFTPQVVGQVMVEGFSQSSGGTTIGQTTLGIGAKYYFSQGKQGDFVPWVTGELDVTGVSMATAFGSATGGGAGISGAIGGTYWLTETAGPFVDLRFRQSSFTILGISQTETDTILEFGATFKF